MTEPLVIGQYYYLAMDGNNGIAATGLLRCWKKDPQRLIALTVTAPIRVSIVPTRISINCSPQNQKRARCCSIGHLTANRWETLPCHRSPQFSTGRAVYLCVTARNATMKQRLLNKETWVRIPLPNPYPSCCVTMIVLRLETPFLR